MSHSEHDRHERSRLQHEAEHAAPRRKVSVMGYLAILFAAAFLLLLLSYFMQQRSNQAAIDGLTDTSLSAHQTLENLITQKDTLEEQVADLEQQLQQAQADLLETQQQAAALQSELEDTLSSSQETQRAMDWLREIQALYVRQRYSAARTMIAEFEATELPGYLPESSLHTYGENQIPAPAQAYADIKEALS